MEDALSLAPDQARAAIGRLPLDVATMAALQDPSHPGHAAANAYRRDLYVAAYREPAADDTNDAGTDASGASSPGDGKHFAPPARPEDYRFDAIPDALKRDSELETKARGWMHRAGAPVWLARNIVAEWNRRAGDPPSATAIEGEALATEARLRAAWGGDYDAKIAAVRETIAALDDPEAVALLDRSGLANSEYLIRQLSALAERRQGKGRP